MRTIENATQVARILLNQPEVQAVELFGSTARNGQGNDLDMILVVPEHLVAHFVDTVIHLARRARMIKESMDTSLDFHLEEDPSFEMANPLSVLTRYKEADDIEDGRPTAPRTYELLQELFGDFGGEIFQNLQKIGMESVDLFCLPPDWKERTDELQKLLPHKDPNFMRNIARDAKSFDSAEGKFN